MRKIFAIFILILLTSCSGDHAGQCIPSNDSSAEDAKGALQNSPEAIFEYVKKERIISTTIEKIRKYLIGDAPIVNLGPISIGGEAGAAQNIFTGITSTPSFKSAISAAFTLAIIFYGLGVATGIIQAQLGDALVRVGKILVVAFIATNWALFYQTVGSFFVTATDEIIGYMLESFGDLYSQGPSFGTSNPLTGGASGNNLFADMDIFFAQVFSIHTFAIIMALISPLGKNAGPYSNIYALFLMYSLFQIMTGIMKVVLIYVFSLFAKCLLFALAPIFFCFLLFNQTKYLFDAWLKLQISFMLQPIFVMALLGLFVSVLSPLFKELYSLQVCLQSSDGDSYNWRFQTKDEHTHASSVSDTPPISLESLFMLLFFSWMFKSYLGLAEQMATGIAQSVTGNLSDTANAISKGMTGEKGAGGGGGLSAAEAQAASARTVKAPSPGAR
jgi:type IV secretory pathway VirB6-like protein